MIGFLKNYKMKVFFLNSSKWFLRGWRPFAWKLGESMELGLKMFPDIPAIPASVPGSVQSALREAGLLPDWNMGIRSLACEWTEHRHWEFFTEVDIPSGVKRVRLRAESLDHSGWITVNGRSVAEFEGGLMRQTFEIGDRMKPGASNRISILFDLAPHEQGQLGFTSRSRHFKPRFAYSWDWCPRLVPCGIGGDIDLVIEPSPMEVVSLRTGVDDAGAGWIAVSHRGPGTLAVTSPDGVHTNHQMAANPLYSAYPPQNSTSIQVSDPQLWWPNGHGAQPLYTVSIRDEAGNEVWSGEVGFKSVRWLSCEGAPEDAEPWICEVNGKRIFLQGVNWTPARPDTQSVTSDDLDTLIGLYREMGCNVLRVWGGAGLESRDFYERCDRAGLMVWQEFPLSSSGLDNWPPEDPEVIARLGCIATDYVRRRSHHASLLMWCGGNELQGGENSKFGTGRPCDLSHPCLNSLAAIVGREMPGIRFLPTSAFGPRFMADEADFGKGIHHDVHGPWNLNGTLDDWCRYWKNDDALFRSETGFPGTMTAAQIRHFAEGMECFPPTEDNLYWMHSASWWQQWDDYRRLNPDVKPSLENYCDWSRALQAEAHAIAASACKARFPRCGGYLIWMGHDCVPCPANTSIIDFERNPKPAFASLQEVFTSDDENEVSRQGGDK